ncbi:MAG TPA: LysE family transporter [Rubrobacter sp.]
MAGGGQRRGLLAVVGCSLGIAPHMLAAMLGLSGIMQAGSCSRRWAGVAYLVFMGASMIRDDRHATETADFPESSWLVVGS